MDVSQLGMAGIDAGKLDALANAGAKATTRAKQSLQAQEKTATDFESMFVSILLKEMRNTLPNGLFGEEGSDVMGGMFDQYMGEHLAQSGSLGIKELILSESLSSGSKSLSSGPKSTRPYLDAQKLGVPTGKE